MYVLDRILVRCDDRGAAPHRAHRADAVDAECRSFSYLTTVGVVCGAFSVEKIPIAEGPPGPDRFEPGRLFVPPPPACDARHRTPGASCANWNTSRPKEGNAGSLVAGNRSTDGGVLCVMRGSWPPFTVTVCVASRRWLSVIFNAFACSGTIWTLVNVVGGESFRSRR